VEWLKVKVLSSNPSTTKKKKKKERKKLSFHLTPVRIEWLSSRKQTIANADKDVGGRECKLVQTL
jgi:hypothetical protein